MFVKLIDVVICTNRPEMVKDQFEQISAVVPYSNFVVVDSSKFLEKKFYENLDVLVVHTPEVKLGCARQTGLLHCKSELVFFVDDDLVLEHNCFKNMYSLLLNSPETVLAVSGKVVYGFNSDSVLFKLFNCGRTRERRGHSGGLVLMKRKPVLAAGGYDVSVHWAEDAELCQRIEQKGFEWIRCWDAVAFHHATFKSQIVRSWRNGEGLKVWWLHGASLFRLFATFWGKTFVMPIYYMFRTKEPRVLIYYFVMSLTMLLGFGLNLKK